MVDQAEDAEDYIKEVGSLSKVNKDRVQLYSTENLYTVRDGRLEDVLQKIDRRTYLELDSDKYFRTTLLSESRAGGGVNTRVAYSDLSEGSDITERRAYSPTEQPEEDEYSENVLKNAKFNPIALRSSTGRGISGLLKIPELTQETEHLISGL